MDLVRRILLAIEANPSGRAPDKLRIEEYTEDQIGYHVTIMMEAGLVEGYDTNHLESESPTAAATRLTWEGHEFLDASRDESRWEKAKGVAKTIGGATVGVLKGILTNIMTKQAEGLL
jgi:hypothetical protein